MTPHIPVATEPAAPHAESVRSPHHASPSQSGIVPDLVQCVGAVDNPRLQLEAVSALACIASTKHTRFVVMEHNAVAPLVALLCHANPDVREQSVLCLGNIAGDGCALLPRQPPRRPAPHALARKALRGRRRRHASRWRVPCAHRATPPLSAVQPRDARPRSSRPWHAERCAT